MPNITVEALLGGAVIENDASQNYRLFRGTKDQIEKYLEGKRRKGEPKEDARDWRCGNPSVRHRDQRAPGSLLEPPIWGAQGGRPGLALWEVLTTLSPPN